MDIQQFAATFVDSTRSYIFIRPEDNLLILRPNQVHNLNDSAVEMLHALYSQPQVDVAAVLTMMSERYGVPQEQLAKDLEALLQSLSL
ncbi:MAG: Coenzyme synthesis protein (PqqD), partial [Chloroflexi bacterium]|nr:Coenzyme synthesis protein (PqqD) [Chloroflexota bacterium]